ncbi:MAG: OmpH family outer membrane protein [Bacteroidales bacterium]|nr:OmpH family outer membrane protein [Bacteroidales bacterium]
MKKYFSSARVFFVVFSLVMLCSFGASAQKMGYVDTDYILKNIPEYQDAQIEIEDLSKQWQEEIELKYADVDKMYKAYQADAVLLPEDLRQKREQEIVNFEREIKELQKKRFGNEGDLFKKRQELIKPIQEKIFNAIEEIATKKNYAFVFDKASGPVIMYVDSKFDISDEVLDQIGSIMGVRGN